MAKIRNIRELRRAKKELRSKIHHLEDDLQSEFSYFQYGMKAAGILGKWFPSDKLASMLKDTGYKAGASLGRKIKRLIKKLGSLPVLLFMSGGVISVFLYSRFTGNGNADKDDADHSDHMYDE